MTNNGEKSYLSRIEKLKEEMVKLSKLIQPDPDRLEIRRILDRPYSSSSSNSSHDGTLIDGLQLKQDLEEMKGLSVQRSLMSGIGRNQMSYNPSDDFLEMHKNIKEIDGVAQQLSEINSSKHITVHKSEQTTTFVNKPESELTLTVEADQPIQILKPICQDQSRSTNKHESVEAARRLNQKKTDRTRPHVNRKQYQPTLQKCASQKDMKKPLLHSSGSLGFKKKNGKNYKFIDNILSSPFCSIEGLQSDKKLQVRKKAKITENNESNSDIKKKLQLNLSQTKPAMHRMIERRHLAKSYDVETKKYESVVQLINFSELNNQIDDIPPIDFPFKQEIIRLVLLFASQYSKTLTKYHGEQKRHKVDHNSMIADLLALLYTLPSKLYKRNMICQDKLNDFRKGCYSLWASIHETNSINKLKRRLFFRILQSLRNYLDFLESNELLEIVDRCNLYTKRNVQGYYSHRSHQEDKQTAQLNKSFKKESPAETRLAGDRKITHLVSSTKQLKKKNLYDMAANFPKPSKSKQLSTRSGKYRSPQVLERALETLKSPKAQNDKIKGKIRRKL